MNRAVSGFRYFDWELGRFITRDPSGYPDGPNNYLYCHNNPINHIDPLGLKKNGEDEEEIIKDGPVRVIGPATKKHGQNTDKEDSTFFQRQYKGKDGKERVKWMKVDIIKDKDGNAKADYDNARTATKDEYKDIYREIYWVNIDKAGIHAMDSNMADTLVALSDKTANAAALVHAEDTGESQLGALGEEALNQTPRAIITGLIGGAVKKVGKAAVERAKNIDKGIPGSQLGPSGKPKIHVKKHPSLKRAKDVARARAGKGGSVIKHPSPRKGQGHFHGVNKKEVKVRVHDEYPKQ